LSTTHVTDLAEQNGVGDACLCSLLPPTAVAPGIVEAISIGRRQPEAGAAAGEEGQRDDSGGA
jgi:hypothetical protein